MTRMLVSRYSIATVFILAALVALTPAARADSDGPCSNQTLRGDYGFAIEGTFFAPQPPNLPPQPPTTVAQFRGVALTSFDGKGKLTQVDHYVVNGAPPAIEWQASTGTYTVNSNCTGRLTLVVPQQGVFELYFVVVRSGKEIRSVVNANLVSSVGVKID